nr:DegT/DnrJ/EryC1/StrS family aminotransferase [uncultured Oscillibacter sp.]
METLRNIPFSPPDITEEEISEVAAALRSGWITTGPRTKEFEKGIAAYCGTERAACLNSATACLELTLRLFGIGPGDEVITSAYTYTATASVIAHVGAKIVLVDTAPGSYEMDYDALAAAFTPRTKAVLPVDVGGILCDYERVFSIVEEKKALFSPANEYQAQLGRVLVLADAAHSFGAHRGGKRSGAFADFTSFSFHAVKNLTTAEGGAVTWRKDLGLDGEAVYKRYQLMSLHGQSKDALAKTKLGAWEYDIVAPLYKCNMTDIMAAVGLVQLRRYPELLAQRRSLVELYNGLLEGRGVETAAHIREDGESSFHLYLTRLTGKGEAERNAVIEAMAREGVASNVHYKPLPLLTAYKNMGLRMGDYPNALAQYQNELTLPLYSTLTAEDAERAAEALLRALGG